MLKQIAAVMVLLLGVLCSAAQAEPARKHEAPTSQDRVIHPALFAVRDADSTMYLFGTVHLRPSGAAWGGPEAVAALNEAQEVWTEMEISPASEAEAGAVALRLGLSRERQLSTRLTPAQAERVFAAGAEYGLPRAGLEMMQPWMAAISLQMAPLMRAGLDPAAGVDRAIDAAADANGQSLRFFETGTQQVQFLAGLSEALQIQMLIDTVDEAPEALDTMSELGVAWESGDLAAIERIANRDIREKYPELYDVLLVQRNDAWLDVMEAEMRGAGVDFVAVGAAHIVGEHGLVAQMRARGYRVERVSPAR